MSWEAEVIAGLRQQEIDFVAQLPDSILDGLIRDVETAEDFDTVRVAREEEAVNLLSGVWLGGRKGALICQSSGLANTFNALGSHAKPAGLPFLGIVTRRGDLGDHNRAQVPAGYGLPKLLEAVGIRYNHLDETTDVEKRVGMAAETAFSTQEPYMLLVERTLTGGKE